MVENLRVLFLEDNPYDVELMERELISSGFKLDAQKVDTEEDFLARLDPPLDIILADFTLPQFNALEALHLLQSSDLDIPFIVVTGTISEEVAVDCMKQGAADYLLKDRLARLGPAVRQALREKELRDAKKQAEAELRASEERYRSIVELSPDAIILYRGDEVVYVNPAGVEQLGAADKDEIIGKTVYDFIHPDEIPIVQQRSNVLGEGNAVPPQEEKIVRLDGKILTVEVRSTPITPLDVPSSITIARDITNRKRRERELQALVTIATALRVAYTRDDIPQVLLDQLLDMLAVDATALVIRDPFSDEMVLEQVEGDWGLPPGEHFSVGEAISKQVIEEGIPFLANDIQKDPRLANPTQFEGIQSIACIPLFAQGQSLGFLSVGRKAIIEDDEIRLFSAITDMAANAIYRANLHEKLEVTFIETVLALAKTLDARDSQTADHSQKLAFWAENILLELGGGQSEVNAVRLAALLHDIGKIGVPDEILRKKGPLTEEEWEVMRKHPEIGAEIVAPVARLAGVATIIRAHQEKYNGSGYPQGLKRDEIPLGARVLAVADAYGAMTIEDRVYRKNRPPDEAVEELKRCAGTDFDPNVVTAFLRVLEKLEKNEDKKNLM